MTIWRITGQERLRNEYTQLLIGTQACSRHCGYQSTRTQSQTDSKTVHSQSVHKELGTTQSWLPGHRETYIMLFSTFKASLPVVKNNSPEHLPSIMGTKVQRQGLGRHAAVECLHVPGTVLGTVCGACHSGCSFAGRLLGLPSLLQ